MSENMIRINVYFGYKFFVIKILSVHTILRIVIFDFFFRHSVTADSRLVSRMCRGKKKACVSYSTKEMVMLSLYS